MEEFLYILYPFVLYLWPNMFVDILWIGQCEKKIARLAKYLFGVCDLLSLATELI